MLCGLRNYFAALAQQVDVSLLGMPPSFALHSAHSGAPICDHVRALSIMRACCGTCLLSSTPQFVLRVPWFTPLASCFSLTARAPDKRIVDTRGRCVAFGEGFNNKSFDRDEAWAAPRSQSSRLKVRPHLFSFLMALFPTEDSPPGPTTMAPGPQNLLTAQLGPKVEIRRLWRVDRHLSGPSLARILYFR